MLFFFLMIRRPPRSTPLSLHDALPIYRPRGDGPDGRPGGALPGAAAARALRGHQPLDRVRPQPLPPPRSEEHTSELQSRQYLVCRLLLEKKKINYIQTLTKNRRRQEHS